MNSIKPIGGYLELDLREGSFPHADALLLNTGRNCLEYILKTHSCSKLYLPKYTCAVMLEPLEKLNIPYEFYAVNKQFEMIKEVELQKNELLVYTNFFGIKDAYAQQLSLKYSTQFVLDASQAFYSEPAPQGHTFYSPRKFFALPDGACLVTDKVMEEAPPQDVSYERMDHILKRIDLGAEAEYEAYVQADPRLKLQPIKRMSKLTYRLLSNIDFASVKQQRVNNFMFLHDQLQSSNLLPLEPKEFTVPMVYPYLINDSERLRQKLIDHKILFARYWRNVLEWCDENETEYFLAKNLLALPISQNYDTDDMQRILNIILS